MRDLGLRITERARAYMRDLVRPHGEGALPALLFGGATVLNAQGEIVKEESPHWYLAAYPKAQHEPLVADFRAGGFELLFAADGMTVLLPQGEHFASMLGGRIIDVEAGRVLVREDRDG